MSNQWVRYVCKDTGDPFWYNNVSREQRWDPPPPPRPTANESTLVSSDSVPGDDEAGKSALKGKAKLDSLAKTSKRKTQDKLVQPPTKKRDVLSDGRVAASETAEIVPPPSRLTAIEASFDPFDQTLNLKDKHVKDKESNMVLVKGLKTKMEELELKIVRPEQPRNRFIGNTRQTQAQNDADHLAHERREDQASENSTARPSSSGASRRWPLNLKHLQLPRVESASASPTSSFLPSSIYMIDARRIPMVTTVTASAL